MRQTDSRELLDLRSAVCQNGGLRFTSSEESATFAEKAANENIPEDVSKEAVRDRRADEHRV
jgi:uncharacterized protein DUF6526